MAADSSTVKITINVVDANSGAVISQTTKNLTLLGTAGTAAGARIAEGAAKGAGALKTTGEAGAASAKVINDAIAQAVGALGTLTPAAQAVQQSVLGIGTAMEATSKRAVRAGGEMQQMLDNLQRSQKKMGSGVQTNTWQGPMRKSANDLAESFGMLGTARGNMAQLGDAFAAMPSKARAAEDAAKKFGNGTAGHATTALDRVRLLSQEFGLRLPRALESMIARMPGVMSAIGALGTAVTTLAIAEVFIRAADAVYQLQQRFFSLEAPAKAFYEQMKKASELDFTNTQDVETTNARIFDARSRSSLEFKAAEDAKQRSNKAWNPSEGIYELYEAHTHTANAYAAQSQANSLGQQQKPKQDHEENVRQIQLKYSLEGIVDVRKRNNVELERKIKLDAEDKRYAGQVESMLGNHTPGNAGAQQQKDADHLARNEAAGKIMTLNLQQETERIKARNTAAEAGLQGEALARRKEADAVREVTAELAAQGQMEMLGVRVASIHAQYDAERLARLRTLTEETARLNNETAVAGKKGLGRVDAERNVTLGGIDTAQSKFSGGAPISREAQSAFDQQRADARRKAVLQGEDLEKGFTDHLRDMDDARANSSMSANQRIDAETRRTVNEVRKAWSEMYGDLPAQDARRIQSAQAVNGEIGRIEAAAAQEKLQLRRTLEDETRRLEDEAGRRGMTREQEAAQAAIDEYNERYRQLEELRGKDAGNADLYRRQEIAAEEIKNGKLLEQERAQRDKLAGIIRGYMSNPLQELRRQGEESASKYAADWVMRRTGHGQVSGGESTLGGIFGGSLSRGPGGILHGSITRQPDGTLASSVHGSATAAGSPSTASVPLASPQTTVSAASATLTAGTATVTITSASIAGLGAGNATGNAAAAASPAMAAAGGGGLGMVGAASAPSSTAEVAAGGFGMSLSGGSTFSSAASSALGLGAGASTTGTAGAGSPGGDGGWMGTGAKMSQSTADIAQTGAALSKQWNDAMGGKSALATKSSAALGKVGGVVGAGAGMWSAIDGNGGLGGTLSGASSGAQLGGMIGGPIGTGIGAAIGAVVGFLGFGGANKAKEYDRKEVKPRIAKDLLAFESGSMDYSSAYDDLVKLDQEAKFAIQKFGVGGKREWDGAIHPEIMTAQQRLTREQKAGRSQYGMSGAQFHNGGLIGDFGSLATTGDQGWIHAQRGEMVVNQQAAPSHYQALQLMNSGASQSDMARYYGAGQTMQPASTANDVHLHFHAHDSKTAMEFFMDNKHLIRSAYNQSYLENSGGADA